MHATKYSTLCLEQAVNFFVESQYHDIIPIPPSLGSVVMCFHITFRVQGLNLNFHWDVSLTPLLTRNIKKTTKMMLLSHTSWHVCVCLCLCEAVRVCLQVYFTIKLIFCFFYFKFFSILCNIRHEHRAFSIFPITF